MESRYCSHWFGLVDGRVGVEVITEAKVFCAISLELERGAAAERIPRPMGAPLPQRGEGYCDLPMTLPPLLRNLRERALKTAALAART